MNDQALTQDKSTMFDIGHLFRMHNAILNRSEKQNFLILCGLFLITSVFDIVGIGAIGYFLFIMMNPSILHHIPIVSLVAAHMQSLNATLILLGLSILVVFLLKTILSCLAQKKLINYCFKVGIRIRLQLMEQCLYAPYSYFVSNHTSDMVNRILSFASSYSAVSLVSFMTMVVHSIFVIVILSFLLVYYPIVTLVLIAMFATMLAVHLLLVEKKLYKAGQKMNDSNKQILQNVQEGLFALKEVRIFSKEPFFLARIKKASIENAEANGFISIFQKLPFYFLESVMFIFIISLCLVELCLNANVATIIATCGTLVTAGIRLLPSLYQIAISLVSSQSMQHSLEHIHHNLFHFNAELKNEPMWPKELTSDSPKLATSFNVIKLANISYQYPNSEKYALNNVMLSIKRGQSIGIIGPSGAGKSTLVDLLLGLLTPTEGQILLDDAPITDHCVWVRKFAYIPQSIYLLDATIKENIIFGEPENEVSQDRLNQAIKMAQLDQVVANSPQGINTIIGENGIKLSGGQRQRIALARAFYHEREIIVMDEATAALDNNTEHEVVEAIKQLQHLKTLIIIAHRYSTVEHCDLIYHIHEGKIVDAGSYEQVIGKQQNAMTEFRLQPV